MNRQEVEKRLRIVESKVKFIMHSLALTRQNNTTGDKESRTFDTLFEEAVTHDLDEANFTQVAQCAFTASNADIGPRHAPGPDGFPGTATDDETPAARPHSPPPGRTGG
jgi:hypothetical protein